MMLGLKNIPLLFFGVSLVILPAFVYSIPINTVDLPTVPLVDDVHPLHGHLGEIVTKKPLLPASPVDKINALPEKLEVVIPKVPITSVPATLIPPIDDLHLPTPTLLKKQLPVVPEKLEVIIPKVPITSFPTEVIPPIDDLNKLPTQTLSKKKLPVLPEKLSVVIPKVPITSLIPPTDDLHFPTQILSKKEFPELKPQVGGVGLQEKIVSEQQLPHVNNTNLLPDKLEEIVQETPQPSVLVSLLHVDKIQVTIPGKLLEKLFSNKLISLLSTELEHQNGLPEKLEEIVPDLSLVSVDSSSHINKVNVVTEKLEEVVPETLHPLAVIASIPQIGHIQLVFSRELLKNIIPKKSISSVPIESKPEVSDNSVLTATLEEIIPEKPFLLVPLQSTLQLGGILPEDSDVVVPKTEKPLQLIEIVHGELVATPKPENSGVIVLPGSLEEIVTEKPRLLPFDELKPQLEAVALKGKKPLPGIVLLSEVGNAQAVLSEKLSDNIPSLALVESNSQVGAVHEKPHPLIPISQGHNDDVLPSGELLSDVVHKIPTILPVGSTATTITHEKLPVASNEKLF